MAYTARTLITRSWYLSGIVARNLQVVSGDQIQDGLMLLNALLDYKSVHTSLIPYWTYDQSLSTVPGQEVYFIENCLAIESVTFNFDQVRYQMSYVTRFPYFGSGRVNNVETLPFNWTFNRQLNGGNLYLYFIPDAVYPLNIMAKFGLQDVTLDQDLELTYDKSYIEYLRYALAQYMCSEYGILFNPESEKILSAIISQLTYVSPDDISISKVSMLRQGPGINWGDVNLGRGFRPL